MEGQEPKFAAWMRKHGKLAVLKDDEVDRLEQASTATSGYSRAEIMDSMYGRLVPSAKGSLYLCHLPQIGGSALQVGIKLLQSPAILRKRRVACSRPQRMPGRRCYQSNCMFSAPASILMLPPLKAVVYLLVNISGYSHAGEAFFGPPTRLGSTNNAPGPRPGLWTVQVAAEPDVCGRLCPNRRAHHCRPGTVLLPNITYFVNR